MLSCLSSQIYATLNCIPFVEKFRVEAIQHYRRRSNLHRRPHRQRLQSRATTLGPRLSPAARIRDYGDYGAITGDYGDGALNSTALRVAKAADHGARRCRHSRMAQSGWPRISDPPQYHPTPRHAAGAGAQGSHRRLTPHPAFSPCGRRRPSRAKATARSDEGYGTKAQTTPHPSRLRLDTFSHKGRRQGALLRRSGATTPPPPQAPASLGRPSPSPTP